METRSAELFLERRLDLQRNVINFKSRRNATINFNPVFRFWLRGFSGRWLRFSPAPKTG